MNVAPALSPSHWTPAHSCVPSRLLCARQYDLHVVRVSPLKKLKISVDDSVHFLEVCLAHVIAPGQGHHNALLHQHCVHNVTAEWWGQRNVEQAGASCQQVSKRCQRACASSGLASCVIHFAQIPASAFTITTCTTWRFILGPRTRNGCKGSTT